jgi:hypothetical protein
MPLPVEVEERNPSSRLSAYGSRSESTGLAAVISCCSARAQLLDLCDHLPAPIAINEGRKCNGTHIRSCWALDVGTVILNCHFFASFFLSLMRQNR